MSKVRRKGDGTREDIIEPKGEGKVNKEIDDEPMKDSANREEVVVNVGPAHTVTVGIVRAREIR